MEDYFKQDQQKKKKNAFKECSMSDCEHLKCNLGQNQEGCLFRPVDEKEEKVKRVAKFLDSIPIIGSGGNRMNDYLAYTAVVLFGLFFITGKELIMQTPDCEECNPNTIHLGKNAILGWFMVVVGMWLMMAPKNAKVWLSTKFEGLMKPAREFIIKKVKRKKESSLM